MGRESIRKHVRCLSRTGGLRVLCGLLQAQVQVFERLLGALDGGRRLCKALLDFATLFVSHHLCSLHLLYHLLFHLVRDFNTMLCVPAVNLKEPFDIQFQVGDVVDKPIGREVLVVSVRLILDRLHDASILGRFCSLHFQKLS
eukprot:24464_4